MTPSARLYALGATLCVTMLVFAQAANSVGGTAYLITLAIAAITYLVVIRSSREIRGTPVLSMFACSSGQPWQIPFFLVKPSRSSKMQTASLNSRKRGRTAGRHRAAISALIGDRMDTKGHWKAVYDTKAPKKVSWFSPHFQTSLSLIQQVAAQKSNAIIDVGGGESTLAEDLISRAYQDITVLDIAQTAIDKTRERLGSAANHIKWLVGDTTGATLPEHYYDLWHVEQFFTFSRDPQNVGLT